MPATFEIEVLGIPELRRRFSSEEIHRLLVQALPDAFEPARAAVQAGAPHGKTGRLAARIVTRVQDTRGSGITITIRSSAGYGHLVEYGHRMVVGGRIARRSLRVHRGRPLAPTTGRVVGRVPPHPFAVPAFVGQEAQVAAILEQRVAAALNAP